MKIQISFDTPDLEKAIVLAQEISPYADMFEIGTVLLLHHGVAAVELFRKNFPDKTLVADTKIVDRGKIVAELFAHAGINMITVMAGAGKEVIHATCTTAHNNSMRVMLDLLDSNSLGQSALEAKNLGADALLFHQAHDEDENAPSFFDKWDIVRGNTDLPIFISADIKRTTIDAFVAMKPEGIIIGSGITEADDPAQEAAFFHSVINR